MVTVEVSSRRAVLDLWLTPPSRGGVDLWICVDLWLYRAAGPFFGGVDLWICGFVAQAVLVDLWICDLAGGSQILARGKHLHHALS